MQELLLNLYNTSMKIGGSVVEQGQNISDTDRAIIMDSVGALLSAVGVVKFNGVFTVEDLLQIKGEQ